jgi:hypothetical protein
MSTVKISQLPFITEINANTEKTLMAGVDLPSGLTGKISMRTLAARLYSNDVLNVGTNPIILENVVAQFTDSSSEYIQINLQNFNGVGSSDFVASANNSNGANNYVDMGINGPGYNDPDYSSMLPYDSYLYSHGPSHVDYRGNLVIGTASSNAYVKFIAGGTLTQNIVGRYNRSLYEFFNPINVTGNIVNTGNVYTNSIIFGDGSIQEGSSTARLNASFLKANNALANTGNATFGYHLSVPDTLTANLVIVTGLQQFSGNALIRTATGTGNFKNITLLTGNEISTGNSGSIDITTGSGGVVRGRGGHISLTPGTGANAQGEIYLNANVSVSNSIYFMQGGSYIDTDHLELNVGSLTNFNIHVNVADGQTPSTWKFSTNGSLIFPDGSLQTTAFIGNGIDSYARTTSNSASSNTIITQGVDATQNTNITTANNAAQAAFIKANNALANTSGTFDGNLTITGNVLTTGTISLNNSSFATDAAFVKITASDGFVTQSPSNTNYMLHVTGKANSVTRLVLDSFGANTYPVLVGRMARGSAATPAAVANNDVMMRIVGNGWTGTQFPPSSPTKIDFVSAENFSDTNRGTRIEFWNTPIGSNIIQKIADFNAESAEFLGTVKPENGFIYTPRILPDVQTAITIDFSSDVIVKASLTNDLTLTLANYVTGKVVEVWLTNTGGSTRTITHGCTATNSSENSTTFTMPSTSSAYLRYFSIDGDIANTFVAIQHA